MRITITLPDPFYEGIKESLPDRGYRTFNDFVLDAIRHQIGAGGRDTHQIGAVTTRGKEEKKTTPITVKTKDGELCKHGYLRNLCKYEECHV